MAKLVFGNMDDHQTDPIFGKVLLVFEAAVNGHMNVKFVLRERQERPIFQRVPALLVNRGDFLIAEEQLDARVYALVNEDAHSRSWLLAKSSTARTQRRCGGAVHEMPKQCLGDGVYLSILPAP